MAIKYKITSKTLDASSANIIALVDIWDSGTPDTIYHDKTFAYDLTDERIADWVVRRYAIWAAATANIVAITDHVVLDAAPIPADAALQAVNDAEIALQKAVRAAQIRALNDPSATDALASFESAQQAVAAAKVK